MNESANYDENNVFVQYVTVDIEDIQVGDWVWSYDTATGEVSQKQVTDTLALESDHIDYLTVIDENGHEQVIETTDSHPFWVVTDEPDSERAAREYADGFYHENIAATENGYWVEAKDLQAGDVFLGANGELSTLVSTERVEFPDGIKVYNFTVDGNHDYFVIAETGEFGQTSVLVHNGACDPNKLVGHHTIPKFIQKLLPPSVAKDPSIVGKRGLPNIKQIPYWLHRAIHTGYKGGAYNARFLIEIKKVEATTKKPITVDQVLKIRDLLVKEFGL